MVSPTAQQGVKGTVVDEKGVPVPGVSVVVPGTTIGTMTDNNGKYTIQVPQGSNSLPYSFIGMKPQVISVDARTTNRRFHANRNHRRR